MELLNGSRFSSEIYKGSFFGDIGMRKVFLVIVVLSVVLGCEDTRRPNRWEKYGKVYYIDGAGNLGFGVDTVPRALRAAGWRGDFEPIIWTSFTGPLGDQLIRVNAIARADGLAKQIIKYRKKYPDAPIYIIALSAGTGVATWAVEKLPEGVAVDSMVFLGSSLANNYDMTKCLKHIKGKIYVFYSNRDAILTGFIPVTGTIDGSYFVKPAGLAGLHPPKNISEEGKRLYRNKIVNIPWRPEFEKYGYAGGHTDGTSYEFVRYFIAPKLLRISLDAPKRKLIRKKNNANTTPTTQPTTRPANTKKNGQVAYNS